MKRRKMGNEAKNGEKNKFSVTGISFLDPELLSNAKARAKRLHLNLSKYVCQLIRQDLAGGGESLTFKESPAPVSSDQSAVGKVADLIRKEAKKRPEGKNPHP